MIQEETIEITEENFKEYFFDVRKNRPKAGQIMARFAAHATFPNSPQKQDIINVLKMGKATQAAAVMRKIHCVKEPDNYRVCREMCEDLKNGLTEQEVLDKEYEFVIEAFYYTQREYFPKNHPHWTKIDLIKWDKEAECYKATVEI